MTTKIEVQFNSSLGSCALDADTFDQLKCTFDVFTSPATNDLILDATAFCADEDTGKTLATIIGQDAANDCCGSYVVFYVE